MIWRLEYENAHGDVARLDIQRGAATPVELIEGTENPFLLSYELEDKSKKGFIMSSFADISIYETATFNIDDLKTLDETALSVKWYINSVLEWTGFVVPDFFSRTIGEPAIVNLAASDRLSSLEDATLDGLSEYVKLKDLAIACLAKTGLSLPLITTVDFKADTTNIMDAFAISDRLEDGKGKKISCFDVLRSILVLTNSTIRQRKGQWRIYNKIQHEALTPSLNFNEVYQGAKRTIQPVLASVGAFQEFGGVRELPSNNSFKNNDSNWTKGGSPLFVTNFDNRDFSFATATAPAVFGQSTNQNQLINRNVFNSDATSLSGTPYFKSVDIKVPLEDTGTSRTDNVLMTIEINSKSVHQSIAHFAVVRFYDGVVDAYLANNLDWEPFFSTIDINYIQENIRGQGYGVEDITTIDTNVRVGRGKDPSKYKIAVYILGVTRAGSPTNRMAAIRSVKIIFPESSDFGKGILYRTDQIGNFSKKSDPDTTIFGDFITMGLNGYFYPYRDNDKSALKTVVGSTYSSTTEWTTATDPAAGELPILQHVTRQMSRMFGVAHNVLSAVIDAKTFDPLAIVTNCAGEKYVIVAATFDFLRSTVEVELQQIAYGSLQRRDFIFSYFGGGDGDGISSIGSVSGGGSSGGSGGGIPQTLDLIVDELFISGGNSVDLGVYARKTWVETEATAYNAARLGGYPAADYARKGQNETVTGSWTFNNNLFATGIVRVTHAAPRYEFFQTDKENAARWVLDGDLMQMQVLNYSTGAFIRRPLSINIDAPNNSFRIEANGDVGLGIVPTERLHVAGNARVDGAVIAGGNVGTSNFMSQMRGWQITKDGIADFRHIYTDELQAKAFTADISQALVGSDILTKSVAKLAQDFVVAASGQTSLFVEELEGFPEMQVFAVNDMLRLRVFDRGGGGLLIKDVWVKVNSYVGTAKNVQEFKVTTVVNGEVVGKPIYKGSMVLDYGTSGSGVIERTVLDAQGSPYSRVVTWGRNTDGTVDVNAKPWDSTKKFLHYQSGNLEGIANCSGWGVYSQNSFLTGKIVVGDLTKSNNYMEYNTVDGLTIKGKITVTGGNAATKQDIDDLEIGGRNLIEQTNQGITNIEIISNVGGATWTVSEEEVDGVRCAKGTKNTTAVESYAVFNRISYTPSKFRANQQYAISFKMKPSFAVSNKTTSLSTFGNRVLSTSSDTYSLLAGEWNHIKLVVTTLPNFDTILAGYDTVELRLNIVGNSTIGDTVLLKDVMIEEGNKASAYAPAPEDVTAEITAAKQEALTAAGNAQTTANSASSAVGTLSGYVDGAFKDGVIDAAEAKAIEKYKNTLNEAMAKTESSYAKVYVNPYLSGAPKTALQNAKINLWGQRDTLIGAINTAIAGGTTTASQKVAVDNAFTSFNSLMSAFQSALEEANKAIQVKLDDIAKGYVDAVQVGGRNYALNTSTPKTKNSWTGLNNQLLPLYVANVSPEWEVGKQVTIAFDVEVSGLAWSGGAVRLASQPYGNVTSYDGFGYHNFFSRAGSSGSGQSLKTRVVYQATLTASMLTNQRYTFEVRCDYITAGSLTIKNFALFYGNRATDWTPSPEDVPSALEYLATAIQDGSTDIEGGLVTTNVLMVKDTNGTVTGGMSGLSNDNVGFWTGGSYQAAQGSNPTARVVFRKDGSFSLGNGKITGTAAGNVTIDGSLVTQHITAQSIEGLDLNFTKGKIGGYTIGSDYLFSTDIELRKNNITINDAGKLIFKQRYNFYSRGNPSIDFYASDTNTMVGALESSARGVILQGYNKFGQNVKSPAMVEILHDQLILGGKLRIGQLEVVHYVENQYDPSLPLPSNWYTDSINIAITRNVVVIYKNFNFADITADIKEGASVTLIAPVGGGNRQLQNINSDNSDITLRPGRCWRFIYSNGNWHPQSY